jgi:hypothetical protein
VIWLVLLALWTATCYGVSCFFWPHTRHGRCNGTGRLYSPNGSSWRVDPGCGGSGRRRRAGVMVYMGMRGTSGALYRWAMKRKVNG